LTPPPPLPLLLSTEIFLVESEYDSSLSPAHRSPLPNFCLVHYVQDDAAPDPRVMLPNPPVLLLNETSSRMPSRASTPIANARVSSPITSRPFPTSISHLNSPLHRLNPSSHTSPMPATRYPTPPPHQHMFLGSPISGPCPVAMPSSSSPSKRRAPSQLQLCAHTNINIPIAAFNIRPAATPYQTAVANGLKTDGAPTAAPFMGRFGQQQTQVRVP